MRRAARQSGAVSLRAPRVLARRSAVPLRNAVAKLVGLKHTPELHFRRNVILQEHSRLEEVWEVRRFVRCSRTVVSCSPLASQALEAERQLEGYDDDSDAESEEDEPQPAPPPRSVPL